MFKKIRLITKNNNRKEKYSESWLEKVNPIVIANYIQKNHDYAISWRAALAISNAKISVCYKDLVLKEEKENLKEEKMEGKCLNKK
ncbi:hypothetical protein OAM12_00765 [Candidatus Pelagibacter sp.]|nr:hypothetical protein [Candidatus Pelagibacter sp.]